MTSVLFSCFDRIKWNREKSKDNEKFLKFITNASLDPLRESKRLRIISQIDRGIDLDILEMDDFKTKRGLGSGAFSEVCLLIRKKDQRKFAGKFLKDKIRASDFINEASIMKSCSSGCTSIVNLVGIITTPRCLVLDYYQNGSLDIAFLEDNINMERGNGTEFPFLRRLGYILDLCHAVEVLHQSNICHRDIALRNLLLSNDKKKILLSDFSLSRIMNSAIERQSTITAIVPEKSAPETFENTKVSAPGSKRWERFYSLKSDIWSLGIVMFEIVDMELINVDKTKRLPSGFPTKRLPSRKIFNRMEELWIQIISCWDENPERRPQSWEVHERIEMLSQNPLNIENENEGYKTHSSDKTSQHLGYHYRDPNWQSSNLWPRVYTDCTPMSRVSVDEIELSGSFMLESPMGSISARPESPDGIDHLTMKDMINRFAQGHKFTIQEKGDKTSGDKHKRLKLTMPREENVRNGQLLLPPGTPSPYANAFSPSIKLITRNCMNSSLRKIYDQSLQYCQGTPGRKFTNIGTPSSLGSCLSLYTPSLTFLEDVSVVSEGSQYCRPLSASFKSSATNIKYCGDRHFFQNFAHNLTPEGKEKNILIKDSEVVEESPSVFQLGTIEDETPRFLVVL